MGIDVCALVRRDHDELDRTLRTLLETSRASAEQRELLDAFRIGLVAHVAAEAAVLGTLLVRTQPPLLLRLIVKQLDDEHRAQLAALDAIEAESIGSAAWSERLLELRISLLEHASREDYFPSTLHDHVVSGERRRLAGEYATERLRAISSLAPLAIAREAAVVSYN